VTDAPGCGDALRDKWNQRHASTDDPGSVPRVLEDAIHLIPAAGEALDLACGRGAGALRLAQAGMRVTAWDFSPVAIDRLRQSAAAQRLTMIAEVRDVIANPPPAEQFDVILVSFFLHRPLAPHIIAALRPGGLLFYQTFSQVAVTGAGPVNPDYRLKDNELLRMFHPLRPRLYREEARLGDLTRGCRDIAMLVAEKPNEKTVSDDATP